MDAKNLVFECVEDAYPDHVTMLGEGYVRRIISDLVDGQLEPPQGYSGGHNQDYTPIIQTVIAVASLVVASLQLYYQWKSSTPAETYDKSDEQAFTEEIHKITVSVYRKVTQSANKTIK